MGLSNGGAGFVEESFCVSNVRVDDFGNRRSSCLRWVKEEMSDRPETTLV